MNDKIKKFLQKENYEIELQITKDNLSEVWLNKENLSLQLIISDRYIELIDVNEINITEFRIKDFSYEEKFTLEENINKEYTDFLYQTNVIPKMAEEIFYIKANLSFENIKKTIEIPKIKEMIVNEDLKNNYIKELENLLENEIEFFNERPAFKKNITDVLENLLENKDQAVDLQLEEIKIDKFMDRFSNMNLTKNQLNEIKKGLDSKVDIRYYTTEHFDENQMYQIRRLLEFQKHSIRNDIEINLLANPQFTYGQMGEIRRAFENNLSIEEVISVANPQFTRVQMAMVRNMFKEGLDIEEVKNIAFPQYSAIHMYLLTEIIRKKGIDLIPDKAFDWTISTEKIIELTDQIKKDNKIISFDQHKKNVDNYER